MTIRSFFDGYRELRDNPSAANVIVEKPALFSLSPDLHNKVVLALGCGKNCTEFLEIGCLQCCRA